MQELFSHITLNNLDSQIKSLRLSNDDIHLWLAEIDQLPINEMANLLSENERSKADNFHFIQDRNRFITSHGLLRTILASYLHLEPAQIDFTFSNHGKPYIIDNEHNLKFNISHSNNLALYAIALDRRIGIDIEFIRHIEDIDQIAEIFLSKRERAKLSKLSEERRNEEFLRYWTLREAYIKAIGGSLFDYKRVNVRNKIHDLSEDFKSPLLPLFQRGNFRGSFISKRESLKWHFETFTPIAGYMATIAVEVNEPNYRFFRVMVD